MNYSNYLSDFSHNGQQYKFYDVKRFVRDQGGDPNKVPYSFRILLENVLHYGDQFSFPFESTQKLAKQYGKGSSLSIPYLPSRVILQDLTGVPAIVDLASLRTAIDNLNGDVQAINPEIQVDLIVDHSVQLDRSGTDDSLEFNIEVEFERNIERYKFFKWAQNAFKNFNVIPPGLGIIHQINLEYLSTVIREKDGIIYPDTVFGCDSHTTMVNSLSLLAWGVGGIEAEAALLGQPSYFNVPEVVGIKLTNSLNKSVSATDLALNVTKILRQKGVVGKFVEFFGEGVLSLSLSDRATVSNMAPEYGATCGFFALDQESFNYLEVTGRSKELISKIKVYAEKIGLMYSDEIQPEYSSIITIDLASIEVSLSGPKRPQDTVLLKDMKSTFINAVSSTENNGFGLSHEKLDKTCPCEGHGSLSAGDLLIASITSCTNTSNPYVLIGAGLVAKKAVELGLTVPSHVKTSLAPGSKSVAIYLEKANLQKYLDQLGFQISGYGCTTCIGNSGPLDPAIEKCVKENDLLTCSVLSGNRNFEARIHPLIKGNYLASPIYVIAYALAGTILKDLTKEPVGISKSGKEIFLNDILPTQQEITEILNNVVTPDVFIEAYKDIYTHKKWDQIEAPSTALYSWDKSSTYLQNPPFFNKVTRDFKGYEMKAIEKARILAIFGDSITTDHIAPAGAISSNSVAAKFLQQKNVTPVHFNTYGSRRGNHEVMMRGAFANIRIVNKMMGGETGPYTKLYLDKESILPIYDAAMKYQENNTPLMIIAGKDYGMGSSRDWAAKNIQLLGVKMVLAESFERIHRANLALMGLIPLEFIEGENAQTWGLTGQETITLHISKTTKIKDLIKVTVKLNEIEKTFQVKLRIDNEIELEYFKFGGILSQVLMQKLTPTI